MALSFESVKKAYEVLNEIKKTVLPELTINSWPEDLLEWSEDKRENPEPNTVYGFDKKSDDGWENLIFFVETPSKELKAKFDELKDRVPNSSMLKRYSQNTDLYVIGWF
ncbi:hypothetical protein [uncultured Sunxiuqinia sp.]|uniref:hypothetical protein n=1 Tax=uncultured Sunxiuqinia sp. TaxID=1573825 RepID=UPI0026112E40|nr:hypothetical protein [uncultured Sunxiuqinia sp.]